MNRFLNSLSDVIGSIDENSVFHGGGEGGLLLHQPSRGVLGVRGHTAAGSSSSSSGVASLHDYGGNPADERDLVSLPNLPSATVNNS